MVDIVLVTHSLGMGGTDRVAVHLANGFSRSGPASLLSVVRDKDDCAVGDLVDDDVSLTFLSKITRGRTRDLIVNFPAYVSYMRNRKPHWALATGNNNAWFTGIGLLLSGQRKRQFAIKITNPIVRPHDGPIKAFFRKAGYNAVFQFADRVLALSEAERQMLVALYPALAHKFRVVANPYVTDAMLAVSDARELRPVEPQKMVLAIGRLHHQKNFSLLLRAMAQVKRPNTALHILGDGPDRAKLEAQVAALGIADHVVFEGYQTDIRPWLERADLLAMSSRYEGLPAAAIEAMAAGCPVVTTDCFPAAREIVGTAPGCAVVPCDDPTALATAIDERSAHPQYVPGLQAVARRYTIESSIESHMVALAA